MQDVQITNEQTVEVKSIPDSLFGVCQAIGEDLGFNPFLLRLGFLGLGFFSIPASVAAYALLGAGVAASRWLFPAPKNAEAASNVDVSPETIEPSRQPELLAA
jgi:phage shock protein PspC (stress-responsive transcriptional regulator)